MLGKLAQPTVPKTGPALGAGPHDCRHRVRWLSNQGKGETVSGTHPRLIKLDWPAEVDAKLGKVSDASIAREHGYHPETVQARRRELGIRPWQQPKRIHRRTCVLCGEPFEVVGGRADRLRKTCPPPKKCQGKLIKKLLGLEAPRNQLKRIQGLLERHVLTDK
jgi:hypothetical protein